MGIHISNVTRNHYVLRSLTSIVDASGKTRWRTIASHNHTHALYMYIGQRLDGSRANIADYRCSINVSRLLFHRIIRRDTESSDKPTASGTPQSVERGHSACGCMMPITSVGLRVAITVEVSTPLQYFP